MSDQQDMQPTILLLEQDEETRTLLRYNLRKQGYRVLVALDEEDALERTGDGRDRVDIILLNQVELSIDEFMNMGRRIRQGARLPSYTPIVVIAERYGADMEGKNFMVGESEYVTYLEDAQQLTNLLHRLCSVK
ncbi:MAG: hypothetical protein IGS49_09115 [Chlorogloeopsis fritschii C42_A2020_084]|uniref:hypothetical protein n=1 Tax=Chlorogloeopsis fritschii TaxID=1124 RepID=UPI0019F8AF1F|nr:hypothetical protein [Chlorogloeopsis fritschii]MBF2005612.1 hypothetical protein [Chlorogloeopsis fritschii C42_A2020_084]